jgi:hypothetical protein
MSETRVERTMKPMLAVLIREAVHMALIDSAIPQDTPDADGQSRLWTDDERLGFARDIYAIPSEAIAAMSPEALAQNVATRLLGTGGWFLPGGDGPIYTGNATPREIFEATLERPDHDALAELAFDLGCYPPPEDDPAPEDRP